MLRSNNVKKYNKQRMILYCISYLKNIYIFFGIQNCLFTLTVYSILYTPDKKLTEIVVDNSDLISYCTRVGIF